MRTVTNAANWYIDRMEALGEKITRSLMAPMRWVWVQLVHLRDSEDVRPASAP